MNVEMTVAGPGFIVLALGHMAVGARWVLPNLTRADLPSTPLGSPSMALGMVRFTWHMLTVVLVSFGVLSGAGRGCRYRSHGFAAARVCRVLARRHSDGRVARTAPSKRSAASTCGVAVRRHRGDVLDGFHMSTDSRGQVATLSRACRRSPLTRQSS
jgi:hypothetical protein